MKFYVSAKDARKGSVKTTVPADTVAARRISSRTVLVLGIVFLLSFVRVAVLVLESSAVCSTFGNSSFPISFLLFVRNSCFYCFVVDSSVRKTVECETSTYEWISVYTKVPHHIIVKIINTKTYYFQLHLSSSRSNIMSRTFQNSVNDLL